MAPRPVFLARSHPAHGTLSGTAPNLLYTPNSGFTGADSFTFTVSDGMNTSAPATVNVTVRPVVVDQPPTASPVNVTTPQDTPVSVMLVGNDPEGAPLTFTAGSPAHGTLIGTGASRTYTPAAGFTGTDTFTYTVSAGGLTSTPATVTIQVTPKAPVCSSPTVLTVASKDKTKATTISVTNVKVPANTLVVALVSADWPKSSVQGITSVTGGGLTWSRAATVGGKMGVTEVWQAYATSAAGWISVTAMPKLGGYDASMTVSSFANAGTKIGATATKTGVGGKPAVTVTPARCGSLVGAVGQNWSSWITPLPKSGQVTVHAWWDKWAGNGFWVQKSLTPSKAGQAVTIGSWTPVWCWDQWQMIGLEIPGRS